MTKIDFYITDIKTTEDYYHFACRLTEKAFRNRHNVYLHTENEIAMQTLDDLLWTFRPNSFLPHSSENSDQIQTSPAVDNEESSSDVAKSDAAKIMVAHSGNPGEHHDVLLNLTHQTPDFFSRFTRVAELVMGDEEAKVKSRQRYKYYRDRGYPLEIHNL